MFNNSEERRLAGLLLTAGLIGGAIDPAAANMGLGGQVQAGGGSIANSTVTLWAAGAGDPKQLAQTKTEGRRPLHAYGSRYDARGGVSFYLIAKGGVASVNKGSGDNPSLTLLAVLGSAPPAKVTINEMTTVASVWTNAQFLNGAAIRGPALSLSIAAGNVHNFVDLGTGGYGDAIAGPLNSTQTPTSPTSPRCQTCWRVARRR